MRACIVLLVVAACSGDSASHGRQLERALPGFAPLTGGTVITLEGSGFDPSDRVLVDGREASLVDVKDATHVDIVVPPGDQPGDVEVVVFGDSGTVGARDILHYSTPPAITSVAPADVVSTSSDTLITITGEGFIDEGAGEPLVLAGGQLVTDAIAVSDTALTFLAPPGSPFTRPVIELHNARGVATASRAFRYIPSTNPGLLLFPRSGPFAVFYDSVTHALVSIPATASADRFRSVIRDANGEYWAADVFNQIGRLDLEAQALIDPVGSNARIPAMTRAGNAIVGISIGVEGQFGTVELDSGVFTRLGTASLFARGSYGIASDGTTVWFTARQDWSTVYINTVDPVTGAVGTPVIMTHGAGFRVEELRYWHGTLYGSTPFGDLVTIDPETGAVTDVVEPGVRFSAFEAYE